MAKVLPTGTDIQIATDAAFMSVVIDDEGGYKTSRSFTRGDLPYGVNLYARIRHTHPQAGTSYWSPTIRFKVITPASAIGVCLDNTDTTKKGVFYWIDAAGNKVDSFNFQNHPTYAGISMATLDADRAPVTMTKIPLFYIKTAAAGPVDSFAAGKKCWWLSDGPLPGFRPAACFKRSTETDANGKRVIAPYCYVGTYLGQQETVAGKNCIGSKKGQTIVSLPKATADQYISNRNVTDGKLYVEDVFSANVYTGDEHPDVITNVDINGYGGMIWVRGRYPATLPNYITDSVTGFENYFKVDSQSGQVSGRILNVIPNGFTPSSVIHVGDTSDVATQYSYAAWTFRKAAHFFDVVEYIGDGVPGRAISHELGIEPGMIIIKCLDNPGVGNAYDWSVWHRSVPDKGALLNTTDAFSSQTGYYCITGGDASNFYVTHNPKVNFVSAKYVAYVFAHNANSDGLIQCGTFTTNVAASADIILGWEPQLVFVKSVGLGEDWQLFDTARGMDPVNQTLGLSMNSSRPENTIGGVEIRVNPNAVGFFTRMAAVQTQYVFMAIRRGPMRTPDTTAVYSWFGSTSENQGAVINSSLPPDAVFAFSLWNSDFRIGSRLQGVSISRTDGLMSHANSYAIDTNSQNRELASAGYCNLLSLGANGQAYSRNPFTNGPAQLYLLKRYPKFFDIVRDSGSGIKHPVFHNLGCAPELIFRKALNADTGMEAWHSGLDSGASIRVYADAPQYIPLVVPDSYPWSEKPNATQFYVGNQASGNINNTSLVTYINYLFATCPGISKVFSFTGNGGDQEIDCGFVKGKYYPDYTFRFLFIKRIDYSGDWCVSIGTSPNRMLYFNKDQALANDDTMIHTSTGFKVHLNGYINLNVAGAKYIGLAIA